jgi:Pectate lyase superfamily protein/Right handed beta helix region
MAIPESIKKLANDIRTKIYGKEVREALAKGIEEAGNIADETQTRQDELEGQFQTVLDETTGKDVISAPEIIAARVSTDGTNHNNLKERLDKEHQEVTSQLAHHTEKLIEHTDKIQNVSTQLAHLDQQKLSKDSLPYVFVDLFGAKGDGVTDDTQAIQNAINSVYEKSALVFRAGGKYRITSTITIDASKIRMLKGNNSYIVVDGDFVGIHFVGNKTFKGTAPSPEVDQLKYEEMYNIIDGLQIYGVENEHGNYQGVGIAVENQHSPVITNCQIFNLYNGIEIRGGNTRNIIIEGCSLWDNQNANIYLEDNGEIHQIIVADSHISYAKYGIYAGVNHNLFNLHVSNCDMEAQVGQKVPFESFFHAEGPVQEVCFTNTTFQDHKTGQGNLVYLKDYRIAMFTGCYFSHTLGNGIYATDGTSLTVTGCQFEDIELDAVFVRDSSEVVINSNNFYDIRKRAVKLDRTVSNFSVAGNQAYKVGHLVRHDSAQGVSLLNGNISDNVIRPISNAIYILCGGNMRNLSIDNNKVYWYAPIQPDNAYSHLYPELRNYAIEVIVSGEISASHLVNNSVALRSTYIGGYRFTSDTPLYNGLIIKNNVADEVQTSQNFVPFLTPNNIENRVIIADNLSVREG